VFCLHAYVRTCQAVYTHVTSYFIFFSLKISTAHHLSVVLLAAGAGMDGSCMQDRSCEAVDIITILPPASAATTNNSCQQPQNIISAVCATYEHLCGDLRWMLAALRTCSMDCRRSSVTNQGGWSAILRYATLLSELIYRHALDLLQISADHGNAC